MRFPFGSLVCVNQGFLYFFHYSILVGHSGHEEPSTDEIPPLNGNKDLFNISGQTKSKLAFIKQFIPKHVKVHLIGHSFGTCQSLDIIRDSEVKEQIQKCYLLFPTFERRKATNSAKSFDNMYMFYKMLGFVLAILFSKIPRIFRYLFFSIYLMVKGTRLEYVDSYVMAAEPGVMEKSLYLTNECNEVYNELDLNLMKENQKLLMLYYGTNDGWVPLSYFKDIKNKMPGIDARLDTYGMEHMFPFKSSETMADVLKEMINENRI